MAGSKYSKFQEIQISNLIEILKVLNQKPDLAFFRGQSNTGWHLLPKISRLFGRSQIPDTWERIEAFILEDFKKYAVPHIDREPKNEFEWMVMGQHYGLPTRLLDWTTNPLKATFFAVNEHIGKRDGALFAFAPTSYIRDLGDTESLNSFNHMIAVFPKMIDNRVVAQEACFTAFPLPSDSRKFKPLEDTAAYDGDYYLLLKMIIPHDRKSEILKELDVLGVNNRTLFPDLSGLSDFISWKYRY